MDTNVLSNVNYTQWPNGITSAPMYMVHASGNHRERQLKTLVKNLQWREFYRVNGYFPQSAHTRKEWNFVPYLGQVSVYNPENGTWRYQYHGYIGNGQGSTNGLDFLFDRSDVSWTHPTIVSHLNSAISQANGKVRDNLIGGAETLAELGKTRQMCVDAASRTLKALRHVKKFRFLDAAKALGMSRPPSVGVFKESPLSGKSLLTRRTGKRMGFDSDQVFHNNWLAYRYGWTPLYMTVHGAMEAQWQWTRGHPGLIRSVRGRSMQELPSNGSRRNKYPSAPWGGNWYVVASDSSYKAMNTYDCRVKYIYRVENTFVKGTQTLGIDNPLLIAWELVPLSFVADWFVNVSDILEQLGLWNGKTFLAGSKSIYYKHEVVSSQVTLRNHWEGSGSLIAPWVATNVTLTPMSSSLVNYERLPLTAPPTVSLQFLPQLNTKRLLDTVALIRVLTKRKAS